MASAVIKNKIEQKIVNIEVPASIQLNLSIAEAVKLMWLLGQCNGCIFDDIYHTLYTLFKGCHQDDPDYPCITLTQKIQELHKFAQLVETDFITNNTKVINNETPKT